MDSTPSETIENYDTTNLELLLNESKSVRIEYIENLRKNRELVWKQISLLTFLLGAFIGFTKFIFDENWEPETISFSLACWYVLIAFLFSLYEIYPKAHASIMDPDNLYELIDENRDKNLKMLIETYLVQSKLLDHQCGKITLTRKLITILTLGFVLQVVIIVYDYLYDGFYFNWFLSLVLASIIITKSFCCYYEIESKSMANDEDDDK